MYKDDKVQNLVGFINQYRSQSRHKFDEVLTAIMEHIEDYLIMTEEEKAALASKNPNKNKNDGNSKTEFNVTTFTEDYSVGIFGNSTKILRPKPIEFREVPSDETSPYLQIASTEIPRTYQGQHNVLRAIWTAYNDISSHCYTPDLTVGGVIMIELFKFPQPAKKVGKWVMRNVYSIDNTLIKQHYPDPNAPQQVADPIQIEYKLPSYVYLTEKTDVRVGWWDDDNKKWSEDDISEANIDIQDRILKFRIQRLAPIAFLQSKCTDYPYKGWRLRCIEEEVAILTIFGNRIDLNFEIGANYVMLIERTDLELQNIVDKKLHPGQLLHELSKCGIHLLPEDEDAHQEGVNLPLKDRGAEERAITDVITSLRAFSFRSAPNNRHYSPDSVVLKVRENLEYDREFFEDYEPDWTYV